MDRFGYGRVGWERTGVRGGGAGTDDSRAKVVFFQSGGRDDLVDAVF